MNELGAVPRRICRRLEARKWNYSKYLYANLNLEKLSRNMVYIFAAALQYIAQRQIKLFLLYGFGSVLDLKQKYLRNRASSNWRTINGFSSCLVEFAKPLLTAAMYLACRLLGWA